MNELKDYVAQQKDVIQELNLVIESLMCEISQLQEENKKLKFQLSFDKIPEEAKSPMSLTTNQSKNFKRGNTRQVSRLFSQKFLESKCESSELIENDQQGLDFRPRGTNSFILYKTNDEILKLSKSNELNQVMGEKLFQNFFIMGPDQSSLKSSDRSVMTVNAKIVSSYPYNSIEKQYLKLNNISDVLPLHIFPNGCQVRKLTIEEHQLEEKVSQIYKIILQTSSSKKVNNEFIFTMKEAQDYSLSDNVNPILKESNPNFFQYCICFEFEDFYYVNKGQNQDIEVWLCPVVYCFMTYYPFISFFQDVNAYIRNMLKTIRCDEISKVNTPTKIYEVDLIYSITMLNRSQEITKILSSLQYQEPKIDQDMIYESDNLSLKCPSLVDAYYLEMEWCANTTICYLSAPQFWFLFTALMLEQHVTLFSVNQSLLSATMLTLINLIRPFKYPFPICFALPKDSIATMELMLPFFFGILGNYRQYKDEIDLLQNEDTIYIDLDTKEIFYSPTQTYADLNKYIPDMPRVVEQYKKINPSNANAFQSFSASKINSQQIQPNPKRSKLEKYSSQLDYDLYKNVFQGFQDFLQENIINHIPNDVCYIQKHHPDVMRITGKMKINKKLGSFATKFIDTQAFSYYLDDNYEKIIDF